MINLIPPQAKKKVIQEYWLRVCTVWLFMTASAFLIVGILLVPTYVLITTQHKILGLQFNQAQLQQDSFKDAENAIQKANELAVYLSKAAHTIPFSELMYELDVSAGESVALTQFTFGRNAEGITEISLAGTAHTRSALAQFSDRLEANPLFSEAKLPLSNLAKDKDIAFGMAVTLAESE